MPAYSEEDLTAAITAFRNSEYTSIRTCAYAFNVPCSNVIVLEVGQYQKSDKILSLPNKELSTTCYDNAITLAFRYIFLDTLFFLFLDFGSRSIRRSLLFRLSLRRLRLRFLDKFEDFLRIKDELSFNSYVLPFPTLSTYS
jgi:hypothetical protein